MEDIHIVEELTDDEVNFKVEDVALQEKRLGLRTLKEVIADLSKELPAKVIKTRNQGGTNVKYISWITAIKVLDYYAPGWCYKIGEFKLLGDRLFVVEVQLGIPTSDHGMVWRSATGIEEYNPAKKMFGDVARNSTSMALRRAAAMFGLCRYLYPN
jgi:hypothetical protein